MPAKASSLQFRVLSRQTYSCPLPGVIWPLLRLDENTFVHQCPLLGIKHCTEDGMPPSSTCPYASSTITKTNHPHTYHHRLGSCLLPWLLLACGIHHGPNNMEPKQHCYYAVKIAHELACIFATNSAMHKHAEGKVGYMYD